MKAWCVRWIVTLVVVLVSGVVLGKKYDPGAFGQEAFLHKRTNNIEFNVIVAVMKKNESNYLLLGLPVHQAINNVLSDKGFD